MKTLDKVIGGWHFWGPVAWYFGPGIAMQWFLYIATPGRAHQFNFGRRTDREYEALFSGPAREEERL